MDAANMRQQTGHLKKRKEFFFFAWVTLSANTSNRISALINCSVLKYVYSFPWPTTHRTQEYSSVQLSAWNSALIDYSDA